LTILFGVCCCCWGSYFAIRRLRRKRRSDSENSESRVDDAQHMHRSGPASESRVDDTQHIDISEPAVSVAETSTRSRQAEATLRRIRQNPGQPAGVATSEIHVMEQADGLDIQAISILHIIEATSHWAACAKIGEGGFGEVYRAQQLPPLRFTGGFAVKRLNPSGSQGFEQMRTEMQTLGLCFHENLLPLFGYCLDAAAKCLIYPLMRGGSLEDRLMLGGEHNTEREARLSALGYNSPPPPLSWQTRLRIIRDTMRALAYLHSRHYIHRDIKPSNILLDEHCNAKVSDVGLAKRAEELANGASHVSQSEVRGTPGYLDPWNLGRLSAATDGYAMGITILVTMCRVDGRRALLHCQQAFDNASMISSVLDAAAHWSDNAGRELLDVAGSLVRAQQETRLSLVSALEEVETLASMYDLSPGTVEQNEQPVPIARAVRDCVVCMEESCATRFNCGHAVCCSRCADELIERGQPCPCCRSAGLAIASTGADLALERTFISP